MKNNDMSQEVENEEVSGAFEEEQDLYVSIMEDLRNSKRHHADWREKARESYDYKASRQWSQEDIALLEEQGRAAVVFNRIARSINAITGLEVQNRQEPSFLPRRVEASGVSDDMTQTVRWVRQNCDAEDEESEMFDDCATCGMGWTETFIDIDDITQPKILVSRIDPLEMLWDHRAKKSNLVDAKWVARVIDMGYKEFKEMFPNETFAPYSFWGAEDTETNPHNAYDAWKYSPDNGIVVDTIKTCSVIQYQYSETEKYYKILSPEGQIVELELKKFTRIKQQLDLMGIKYLECKKKEYKQCFITNGKIISTTDLASSNFTFQPITGFRDRNENTWFGMVELMKDPQRWANKWLSQIQYIVNSGAKNGLIVEEGVLKNPRRAEEEWAKPGSITTLNAGGLGKIMPKPSPQYPDGVDRLLQYAMGAIQDVVGVNLELLGLANRDQPIGLEESRKEAGVTILASFFDSLRRYRKIQGRVLVEYIQEYLPDGTLVRIVGESGAKYVPLMKSKLSTDFDVLVDDAPTSPNIKERSFMIINQIVPMALQAGIPIPPEVLDYAPLPENLIQKWKQMIISKQQDPTHTQMQQMQQLMAQIELQQRQANVQKTSSEVVANYAKAEQASSIAKDESAQAMQKLGIAQAGHQMKMEEMLMNQRRKDLEMLLNARRKYMENGLYHNPVDPQYQSNDNFEPVDYRI